MSIQHMIWRVGDQPQVLPIGKLPSEQALEAMIVKDPRILSGDWMLIGSQEQTGLGGRMSCWSGFEENGKRRAAVRNGR